MGVPEREPERLEDLEISPAQRPQHPGIRPVKLGQEELAAGLQHPASLLQHHALELMRQFVQEEEQHIGAHRLVGQADPAGILQQELDLLGISGQLGLGVHQFVVDDVDHLHLGCAGCQRGVDDQGHHIAKRA